MRPRHFHDRRNVQVDPRVLEHVLGEGAEPTGGGTCVAFHTDLTEQKAGVVETFVGQHTRFPAHCFCFRRIFRDGKEFDQFVAGHGVFLSGIAGSVRENANE